MSYSTQSSSTRSYQYSSSGGPGQSKVTEIRTTTGPDGKSRTETKTYGGDAGGDFGDFGQRFGGFDLNDFGGGGGGGTTQLITQTSDIPAHCHSRYHKGWGHRNEHRKDPGPPMQLEGKTFEEIRDQCLREGRLFEDPDFPATDSTIFYSSAPPRPFTWKRPPELVSDPKMFVGGASRFDIKQGELGDCWFLAAVACLCQNKEMLHRVVPDDHCFTDKYAGIFRFYFWQYGHWKEVVVDDRLPTYYDRLVFMHSHSQNEFWSSLLEKAYAKLEGSYEALKGGATSEAMEDFTGGVTEQFDFREKVPPNMFQIMMKAYERSSLMGCSIEAMPGRMEAELSNGLIMGHAYSITCVKMMEIKTSRKSGSLPMVRVRNPWGNECEWKGAWSDKSQEWKFIPEEDRQEVGLTFDDDGEFWMSFSDFTSNFQKLEICNLGPEGVDAVSTRRCWEQTTHEGSWRKRVTAGGCRNYIETFWTNPQYRIQVVDADEDDDENVGTLIVGLMQKHRRKLKKQGVDLLTLGYCIYKLKDGGNTAPLDMNYFKYNASVAKSPSFINLREICGRHRLPPGHYCVVPSTFEPNHEGDFLLRVFSEKPAVASEMDEETGMSDVQVVTLKDDEGKPQQELTQEDQQMDGDMRSSFKKIAGADMEIDAYELKDILNAAFLQEFKFDGFSSETTRSLVAMKDVDRSGKLGYDEFKKLWNDIRLWKGVFKQFDKDRSGNFNSYEMRMAFHACGFKLSNSTFNSLVQRYAHKDGKIYFDDYIHCIARLKTMFDIFKDAASSPAASNANFELDQFIQTTMYS